MLRFFASICFFILLSVTGPAVAGQDAAGLQQALIATQEEVKALKVQTQVMQSYQDRFLTTVFWALGTLATIAALLVGFGWYANFRILERDKANLAKELQGEIDDELKRLSKLVGDQIASLETLVNQKVEAASAASVQPIKSQFERLKRETSRLELDVLEMEREKWAARNHMSLAANVARKILEVAIQLDFEYRTSHALDAIKEHLEKLLLPDYVGPGLNAREISAMIETLDKVDAVHAITTASIREKLAQISASRKVISF